MTKDTALLVATIKNEGPNILEWVAHHRLCGFDRIQIFQNDSTDTTEQTLHTLYRLGVIEFFQNRDAGDAYQRRAYRRASRSASFAQSDWCMVLDGDEFLNIKTGAGKVTDLIDACPDDADAILVNWRVFGSNGHREFGGELVTERFTQAEPAEAIESQPTPFKALARTAAFGKPGVHVPRDPKKDNPIFCNGSGLYEDQFQISNWRSTDPLGRQYAQVNHYMLRDLPSFLLKHARHSEMEKDRDIGLTYWEKHDRNEEEDTSLASHAFELWSEMKRLNDMSEGKLLRLRQRGIQKSRMALDELLERDDIQALRDSILSETTLPMAKPFKLPGTEAVFSSVRSRREAPEPVRKTATG